MQGAGNSINYMQKFQNGLKHVVSQMLDTNQVDVDKINRELRGIGQSIEQLNSSYNKLHFLILRNDDNLTYV